MTTASDAAPEAPANATPMPSAPAQPASQASPPTPEPAKPQHPGNNYPPGPTAVADPGDGALPDWVKARIEQAKRAGAREVLSAVGVDKPEDAKAAVERAKAQAEAEKTAQQKALEASARAEALQKERDELFGAVSLQDKAALDALTPEQKAVVHKLAGDSPARQIEAIETLRPTWARSVETKTEQRTAAAPAEAPKPAPLPPPATTASPAASPAQPPPPPAPDHLAEWERRKSNPFEASRYYDRHKVAIVAAQQARDAKKSAS